MTIREAALKHGLAGEFMVVSALGTNGGPRVAQIIAHCIIEAHHELERGPAKPGEVLLKVWVDEEAQRTGLKPTAVYNRIQRGKYPELKLRRVNARTIYVQV